MKSPSFSDTPEFQRNLPAVQKSELDELVRESKEHSPRKGNPKAPWAKAGQALEALGQDRDTRRSRPAKKARPSKKSKRAGHC